MDLLEYQAKELFSEIGIPVLPSQKISDARDLKKLQIPYPVVLKSQVRAGGRGRAGGIRFVENTIDAIAAARTIFSLPILGEYPQVLLAEAQYDAQQELFLAVALDYQLQCPVLLGSAQGGIDIKVLLENLQKVLIKEEFSPFYARRLAIKMGLSGGLVESVSNILEKMYYLFSEKDLDFVEINPLGVSAEGGIMALDGKITVNDYALGRHPEVISLTVPQTTNDSSFPLLASSLKPRWLEGVEESGRVGLLCNSVSLAQATWDLIAQEEEKIGCCVVIGESLDGKLLSDVALAQQLEQTLEQAMQVKGLNVLFINVLGSPQTGQAVTQALSHYLQHQGEAAQVSGEERKSRPTGTASQRNRNAPKTRSKKKESLPIVLRLTNHEDLDAVKSLPIHWTENLGDAVAQTLSLANGRKSNERNARK